MAMDPNRLWAKSKGEDEAPRPSMFLPGHLQDVYASAMRVLDSTADEQLKALGLDCAAYRERFRRCVLLAAAVHDLGKANDHFQGMLLRSAARRDRQQGLRHEWVTLLIMQRLGDWLLPAVGGSRTDLAIVEWAVTGHHPAHNHESPPRKAPDGCGVEIQLLTAHPDFKAALEWIRTTFGLEAPPKLPHEKLDLGVLKGAFVEINRVWKPKSQQQWDRMSIRGDDPKLIAAVKNTLVAADIAGSALPKLTPNPEWQWITDSFADLPASGDLQSIVDARLAGAIPRSFQTDVSDSTARVTFVKAGCGSGKTLAAYMWAAKNHPTRRLFFCYPTTGTATEGFKDYLFIPELKEKADLFHSRREVDFEIVLKVNGDTANAETDAALRVDALDSWSTPIVACTVDTVLGIVQNNKRGLFAWPALAQSAFVFDEIHAYDDRLFGALLRFLRDLPGLPALLMTASLPNARHDALRDALKAEALALEPICGPPALEALKRYKRAITPDSDPLPLVCETHNSGGKVLWVCNTVQRVITAAVRAAGEGLKPIVYHSRFKYEDRVQQHAKVIDAFKGDGPALAICSQVAEMSLDLSANLLVTDLAPVPALIQRLGRLNRRATKDESWPFVVVEPDNHLPYTQADLDGARAWLARLGLGDLGQRDLASAWEQTEDRPTDVIASAWLDGGPTTTVTDLREVSPGITVLMREDVSRAGTNPKKLGRYVLPMPPPRARDWNTWPKFRGVIPIAEPGAIIYDAERGAEWA
ncbi:CRISPR-associated helicase Cas3' [Gemmata sp. JC717]|uniref:CRISPR-associated helicase Cas3' n=1 Tax=Gemmata algarum TaxID=2975278 RepID=UPI0021BA8BA6|nr:CRISPR-associated helicase Cas3' [Gemmata algarum]MDY3556326.1 CRISPR-associated helicase Cas3' [Gemmata algarum]